MCSTYNIDNEAHQQSADSLAGGRVRRQEQYNATWFLQKDENISCTDPL